MTLIADIHRVLVDHCTLVEDEKQSRALRQRYISHVQSVLADSQLGRRTPAEVWALGWDKPFFSNVRAAVAEPAVILARQSGLFDNARAIASPEFLEDGELGSLALDGIKRGQLIGVCKAAPRLRRVQSYARAVPQITEAVNLFYEVWGSGSHGAEELQALAVSVAEDISAGGGAIGKVEGFGFTTACHLLADLGLPVFKPDIWVCRVVSALPRVRAEIQRAWKLGTRPVPFDFLEKKMVGPRAPAAYRRIVQPVLNALVSDVQHLEIDGLHLAPAFLRARFVDWTLVHFAISANAEISGLVRRPVDLLCGAGEAAARPHLHALARWLRDGQAAHEAGKKLISAKKRRRDAQEFPVAYSAPADHVLIERRAQEAWAAWDEASISSAWEFNVRFPDDFVRNDDATKWRYIHAARSARNATSQSKEPAA
ncbi:hypothetical protein RAS12_30680 (plasmid) [Achromobacter seleniivolatilans]|uniref:UmuC domain-containing protein n=1 Tax=Achromobacter seleniivolatilans TaxID=3047478 RepID=A0ABY9MAF3_9BURK|nr:hypothetical protein [Achromobacter sp. R39]WMD24001.1 hypothetical protein RAS12_30680 [Achromobacter sp. R39]